MTTLTDCLICPWRLLKAHVDYWWCFDYNIELLRDRIRDLERQTHDIRQKIEGARNNAEILRPGVEEWLNYSIHKLDSSIHKLYEFFQDDDIPEAWKLISRYILGKNAKETAEEIAKHLNNGKFDLIAYPAPSAAMASPPHRSTMDFESRKGIEEDIIQSLTESSVDTIGICGMEGVGKTTMAQRIWKRVKDEDLFDEVVMVTVGQNIDMLKIQDEIAEWLNLKFVERFMSTRAAKLHWRLMDTKRKIIIFDDVWERLKLEDLGVPFQSGFERCKILFTTRSKDVCEKMEAQKIISMEILTEKEAWILFKEKAGDCVEDSTLLSVARNVAAECKGLPIALVTVGMALRNKEKSIWVDSLSQLRGCNPTDFPEVLSRFISL